MVRRTSLEPTAGRNRWTLEIAPRAFRCSPGTSGCLQGPSRARRGRIIIFYSQHPSGEADEYSLHGGCKVKKGTKWSANKWILDPGLKHERLLRIWNKPMDFIRE